MFTIVGSASAASFSDVTGTDAQPMPYMLTSLGIIDGYPDGTFGPKNHNRAEFAKIAVYLPDYRQLPLECRNSSPLKM